MYDQLPLLSTVAGPDSTTLPVASLISTLTVAPASVLPETVGVVSLVGARGLMLIVGACVSTDKPLSVAVDGLPAASFAVASTVYAPSGSVVDGVYDQLPLLSTVAGPESTTLPVESLTSTVTVAPGSVLPVTVGVVSLVGLSGSMLITGKDESTSKPLSVTVLSLPAGSFAVTSTSYGPSGSGLDGV